MIRYYIARIAGKLAKFGLKVLNRKIPYYPGYIALKICPKFIELSKKPKIIIAVTGTNGKSTICNLLKSSLEELGNSVINNEGFNISTGIASMFLNQKGVADVAVMEVDEVTTEEIFKKVKPNYLICTNLFRDSMRSNSNIDYVSSFIIKGVPKETKLILNADDLITVGLGAGRKNIYFGIEKPLDKQPSKTLFSDLVYCPKCDSKLEYLDIKNYHIGNVKCPKCGYTNPKRDYNGEIDYKNNLLIINGNNYPLKSNSIFNIYNYLAVISLLLQIGYSYEKVRDAIDKSKIINSRFEEEKIKGITLVNHMAKGQNPVATSSVIEYVINESGTKDVLIMLDDTQDSKYSSETVNWYYDINFEILNKKEIKKIIIGGKRCKDVYVRFLLAGISKNKIITEVNEYEMYKHIDLDVDKIFLLHDITSNDQSMEIAKQIKEVINNEN